MKPKAKGGLGFGDLHAFNIAMLARKVENNSISFLFVCSGFKKQDIFQDPMFFVLTEGTECNS